MTDKEYEQKRRECWEKFKRENLDGEVQWQPVSRYDVFCAAFDRAYALGKQEKDAEPKFKVGEKVRISCAFSSGEIWDSVLNGRVATIVGCYRESNNWIYCFKEPIRDFAEFWLEPCTEQGNYMGDANDRFNHIADVSKMMGYTIIDGIDETGRLHVAAMAMQGMLAAGEDYSGDCTFILKKSFEIADALIAGCKKE